MLIRIGKLSELDRMKEGLGLGTFSGLIASLCCIGPVVIVLLGLGPIFGMTGLCMVELRPVFLTLGVITLASGILLWIKRKEGYCNVRSARKHRKVVLASVVAMAISYLFFIELAVPFLKTNFALAATCSI